MSRVVQRFAAGRRERLTRWRARLLRFGQSESAPLREDNSVALYASGGEFLRACATLVTQAERSIDVEMYIWAHDRVGDRFVELLRQAHERGVRVRLVYDAAGSIEGTAHVDALADIGIATCLFRPLAPWRLRGNINQRNHRKLVIADDSVAVLGGANWSEDYDSDADPGSFLDTGVGLVGRIVEDIALDFRAVWKHETGEELPPPAPPRPGSLPPGRVRANVPVQLVSSARPEEGAGIRRLYGLLIRSARTEIEIAIPYFVPPLRLLRALRKASRRGVRVVIVLPGKTDIVWAQAAARATYARLVRAGALIYERQDRVLHSKVASVDRQVAVVGTANLDSRSFRHNLEINVNIHHQEIAEDVAAYVHEQVAGSVQIDLAWFQRRTAVEWIWQRLAYALRYWF